MRISRSSKHTTAMTTLCRCLSLLSFLAVITNGFAPAKISLHKQRSHLLRPTDAFTFKIPTPSTSISLEANRKSPEPSRRPNILKRIIRRFDVLESAGFDPDTVQTAGIFRRVKDLHNPITYIALSLLAGLKWRWCFQNPYYWFGVAFCVKWYRARYVFKIPVWDRQPNWNNIITSKEQEKDLKAFTCKNCGSTIFIAKTREFFFEGNTGIGGLGCFSCGAKGKENFENDRDRILEDVADIDDYFEYERPLDFVTRAERRQLLKDAKGDEKRANLLLVERTTGMPSDDKSNSSAKDDTTVEAALEETQETLEETAPEDAAEAAPTLKIIDVTPEPEPKAEAPPAPKKKKTKKKKVPPPKKAAPEDDDILDMDDL